MPDAANPVLVTFVTRQARLAKSQGLKGQASIVQVNAIGNMGSLVEHHRLIPVEQDTTSDVSAHRPREHCLLKIASFLNQIVN